MEFSADYKIQYITKQELRESNCCRFCGCGASKEASVNDVFIELYEKSVVNAHDSNPLTLDILANKYLPLRVSQHELYYPRVICSSCNYALDVTIEFFKKITVGQKILSTIINESSHDKGESAFTEPNNSQSVSPTMVFSSENPVLLAPKRRGRPRRDPNCIKPSKAVLTLPSEFLGVKPKRQSRRPARYNPALPDSSDRQVVVKDESHEFPTSSETENLFPFLSVADGLEANKSGNKSDATFSFGKVQIHQSKTDNALLLGNTPAEFTSLTHAENLMDLSKLSVIMDGDEEIDSSSLEPIIPTISIIKSDKLSESVTRQHANISFSGITEEPTEIVGQDLVSWRQDPIACLTINPNEEYRDSDDSVRTIDFVVRKKIKRGRKKTRRKNKKKKLECSFCKKEFSHPSSLAYHRNSVHNSEKRFVCKICKKAFSHKQLLANHANVHSDVKGFKCQLCPAKFKSKASLYTHNKSIHTENSGYTCDQCGYQFNLKSSLKAHLRLHTGEKPYSCEFCHKEFSQKSNYSEHRRIHTGERPYKCDTTNCDKAFTTASQLRNHKITHTGTKQYLCSICGRGFTHGENFKYHMRRHNGEKPIECPICLKPFTEPCSLKKHWRLHTGEKPYACEICNKLFSDPSNYAKHKKVHINEVSSKTVDSLDLDPNRNENQQVDVVSRVEVETESPAPTPIMEGPQHVVEEVGDFNTDEAYVQILNPENLATLDGDTQEGQQVIYLYPHDLSYYTITLSDNQDPVEVRPHEETLQTLGGSISFAAMDADIAAQYFNLETVSDSSVNIPRVADATEGGATTPTISNNTTVEGCGDFLGSRVIIEPTVLNTA